MELGLLPYDGFSLEQSNRGELFLKILQEQLHLQDSTSFERKRGTLSGLHQLLNLYK